MHECVLKFRSAKKPEVTLISIFTYSPHERKGNLLTASYDPRRTYTTSYNLPSFPVIKIKNIKFIIAKTHYFKNNAS